MGPLDTVDRDFEMLAYPASVPSDTGLSGRWSTTSHITDC